MIKYVMISVTALITGLSGFAQQPTGSGTQPYTTTKNSKETILKGLLSRSVIESDTSFTWFQANYKLGRVDAPAVDVFKKKGDSVHIIVFGGTWCEDTQNLLPQLYRLADSSHYADSNITLIGVDRQKKTLDGLSEAFHITNVPTFIVMKNGKEVGRIVEYGKYGQIDKELGEIVEKL